MERALHIGVLGAMPEEIGSDLSHLQQLRSEQHGDLTIHHGTWGEGIRLSLAWSGWGKVSAARAATRPVSSGPGIELARFTGGAGAARLALVPGAHASNHINQRRLDHPIVANRESRTRRRAQKKSNRAAVRARVALAPRVDHREAS